MYVSLYSLTGCSLTLYASLPEEQQVKPKRKLSDDELQIKQKKDRDDSGEHDVYLSSKKYPFNHLFSKG